MISLDEVEYSMKLVFLGPPGAGKGTQAAYIAAAANIPTISTGAMLREAIANKTELGKAAEGYTSKGALVPDEVVIGIVKDRLTEADCKNGYILDGFPRTVAQAQALDGMMPDAIDVALSLEVPDEAIIERLTGRRECKECKATFHIKNNPSAKGDVCDKCGGELIQRADDSLETIKNRMSVYHAQTEPIKDYYKDCGKLKCVNGVGSVEEIKLRCFRLLAFRRRYDYD